MELQIYVAESDEVADNREELDDNGDDVHEIVEVNSNQIQAAWR